ncbi:LPD38 domain-containing protein [Oceanidesulfovibrio marinus]|uniref:GGDEF domain-containing protein n=1 Tax=Oceanidesulfovibrio marinus TaxID=370038 RepID=A0A6P1ZB72_9BACT|nr:LPD38 domain-containing protein [Oceanidesulfovibrio marinus]TVM31155.1 hypothetical protein DQK91_18770 [Oceanidesulfovibrio marinus]
MASTDLRRFLQDEIAAEEQRVARVNNPPQRGPSPADVALASQPAPSITDQRNSPSPDVDSTLMGRIQRMSSKERADKARKLRTLQEGLNQGLQDLNTRVEEQLAVQPTTAAGKIGKAIHEGAKMAVRAPLMFGAASIEHAGDSLYAKDIASQTSVADVADAVTSPLREPAAVSVVKALDFVTSLPGLGDVRDKAAEWLGAGKVAQVGTNLVEAVQDLSLLQSDKNYQPGYQRPNDVGFFEQATTPEFWTGFAEDIAYNVPQMGMGAALTALTGGKAGTAYMGAYIGGGDYEKALEEGFDDREARRRAFVAGTANAAVQAPLEMLGLQKIFKALPAAKTSLATGLRTIAEAGLTEYFTEALQTFPEVASAIWKDNPSMEDAEMLRKIVDETVFSAEFWKNANYSGMVGLASGGGMSAVSVGGQMALEGAKARKKSGLDYDVAREKSMREAVGELGGPDRVSQAITSAVLSDSSSGRIQNLEDRDIQALEVDLAYLADEGVNQEAVLAAKREVKAEKIRRKYLPDPVRQSEEEMRKSRTNIQALLPIAGQDRSELQKLNDHFRGVEAEREKSALTDEQWTKADDLEKRIANLEGQDSLTPRQRETLDILKGERASLDIQGRGAPIEIPMGQDVQDQATADQGPVRVSETRTQAEPATPFSADMGETLLDQTDQPTSFAESPDRFLGQGQNAVIEPQGNTVTMRDEEDGFEAQVPRFQSAEEYANEQLDAIAGTDEYHHSSPKFRENYLATDDEVTGYIDARTGKGRSTTLRRAVEHIQETGKQGVYLEWDLTNLGGLNNVLGHSKANEYYSAAAQIVREELENAGAESTSLFRHGGDEMSSVMVGISELDARAALTRAQERIQALAAETTTKDGLPLSDIPHTKAGRKPGVGIAIGATQIDPMDSTDKLGDIFSRADEEVERAKKREVVADEQGIPAETIGVGAPVGQRGSTPEGTGDAVRGVPGAEESGGGTAPAAPEGVPGDVPAATEPAGQEGAVAPESPQPRTWEAMPGHYASRLLDGETLPSTQELRKEASRLTGEKIEPGTPQAKRLNEVTEAGVVQAARAIVDRGRADVLSEREVFDQLVDLYNRQPNLSVRTSTSVENQAYSTPVPIAYLASRLAGIDENTSVYEPTAGHGALLIEAGQGGNVIANELDENRAESLRQQGFIEVMEDDATEFEPRGKVGRVIANPPFGKKRGRDGRNMVWDVGLYETQEIDHAIALKALESMADDGRAVLILGGKDGNDGARAQKYKAQAMRAFYAALGQQYNIVDHFSLAGDLYTKQGAGYPIDIIVIEGRNESGEITRPFPHQQVPRMIGSYEELGGMLDDQQSAAAIRPVVQPGQRDELGGAGAQGDQGTAGGNVLATPGATSPVDAGTGGEQPGTGARGAGRPDGGRSGERPGSRDVSRQPEAPGATPGEQQEHQATDAGQTPGVAGVAGENRPGGELAGVPGGDQSGDVAGGAATVDEAWAELANEDIDALIDSAVDEAIAGEATSSAQATPQEGISPAATGKRAATETATAADEALRGLYELFGGADAGRLASGFTFDEETFRRAKPHFQRAFESALAAGKSAVEAVREVVTRTVSGLKHLSEQAQRIAGDMVKRWAHEQVAAGRKSSQTTTKEQEETAFQVAYVPGSKATSMGTLVPTNMADAAQDALASLKEKVGDLDVYVAKELGYEMVELGDYFAAEQIDAIALSIHNISQGKGFIIGDQTGIGKGRVNAAMIRYAQRQGRIPVFVTRDNNLYSDMIRDLFDIGETAQNPLVTNNNLTGKEAVSLKDGTQLPDGSKRITTKSKAAHEKLLDKAAASDDLGGHNVVFTTYYQMQETGSGDTARRRFIREIAPRALFIFDESHMAGGVGTQRKSKNDKDKISRSDFVRKIIKMSPQGVFFSSATYAKRPNVMSLYTKTDLGLAIQDAEVFEETAARGGIPLQQIIASMLSRAGQYIRRERSYKGVTFQRETVAVHTQGAETSAAIMRGIIAFDTVKKQALETLDSTAKESAKSVLAGGSMEENKSTGLAGADSTNFAALMHNVISQSLLAAKADATADAALAALERGEKPVIALANTMGAFIEDAAKENNVKPGEHIDLTFRDVFLRYLEKSRQVTIKDAFGKVVEQRELTDKELGPAGVKAYEAAREMIVDADLDALPVSPIDHIKLRLERVGYRVDEITGREHTLDYSGKMPAYRRRKKNNAAAERGFNMGQGKDEIHALIINQSGSTGISLHASEKFKNQQPRHMILAQAEADVNVFMQMLGRIFRTGQVHMPTYTLLETSLPAEKRPNAVLQKKLASLNANTTAGRKTSVTADDSAPDFMNNHGDKVVAEIMFNNPSIHDALMRPLKPNPEGTGLANLNAMSKVTGRIPILPVQEQEKLYDLIEAEYADYISALEQTGSSDLEAKTLELDARTITSMQITEGVPGSDSEFAAPAKIERVDVKLLGKSYTSDEVLEKIRGNVPEGESFSDFQILAARARRQTQEKLEKAGRDFEAYVEEKIAAMAEDDTVEVENEDTGEVEEKKSRYTFEERVAKLRESLRAVAMETTEVISAIPLGQPVQLTTPDDQQFYGVVTNVKRRNRTENPMAPSDWEITFAVADATRQLVLPTSRLTLQGGGQKTMVLPMGASLGDAVGPFDRAQKERREERLVVTGNIPAGYSAVKNRGQIVNFIDNTGTARQGVLLSRNTKEKDLVDEMDVAFTDPGHIFDFMARQERSGEHIVKSADTHLFFQDIGGSKIKLSATKSKAKGGRYYLDGDVLDALGGRDFVSSGDKMRIEVSKETARRVIEVLQRKGIGFVAQTHKEIAREITGQTLETERVGGVLLNNEVQRRSLPGQEGRGISIAEVQAIADEVAGRMADVSNLQVLDSPHSLPTEIRERLHASDYSATGLYYQGTAYIFSQNVTSTEDAHRTIMHELSHLGLDALATMGPDIKQSVAYVQKQVDEAFLARRKEISEFTRKYYPGFDLSTKGGQRRATGEWLAEHAIELAPRWYDRYLAAMTNLFRRVAKHLGFNMTMSEAEIRMFMAEVHQSYTRPELPADAVDDELFTVPAMRRPEQEFTSEETSQSIVPSTFNVFAEDFKEGTRNLDLGGGKHERATERLAEMGIENLVYDPFARDAAHNARRLEDATSGGIATITVNNVLNVIKEPAARESVIKQAARFASKKSAPVYFKIYEGNGKGEGTTTSKGWQENRKAATYEAEISQYFKDVIRKGDILVARDPADVGTQDYYLSAQGEESIQFRRRTLSDDEEVKSLKFLRSMQERIRSGKTKGIPPQAKASEMRKALREVAGSAKDFSLQEYIWSGVDSWLAKQGSREVLRADVLRFMADRTADIQAGQALALANKVGRTLEAGAQVSRQTIKRVMASAADIEKFLKDNFPNSRPDEAARALRRMAKNTSSGRDEAGLLGLADAIEGVAPSQPHVNRAKPLNKKRVRDVPRDSEGQPVPRTKEQILEDARSKIGEEGKTLLGRIGAAIKRVNLDGIRQGLTDQFRSLDVLDQKFEEVFGRLWETPGEEAKHSAYINARMTSSPGDMLMAALKYGPPRRTDDGGITVEDRDEGLISILDEVGENDIQDFFAWIVGNRAEKLRREGREMLFDAEEIAQLKALKTPERAQAWDNAHKRLEEFRKKVVSFAAQSGIINPHERGLWENQFYVPFYRVTEDAMKDYKKSKGRSASRGLANQRGLFRLKGSDRNIGDPLENLIQNFTSLMASAQKNYAAKVAIRKAMALGLAKKVKMGAQAKYTTAENYERSLRKALGETSPLLNMTQQEKESLAMIFFPAAPKGENVVSVMVNGKPVYYEIGDPLLFSSLTSINQTPLNHPIMRFLRLGKRTLTRGVTITPAFRLYRNLFRDTLSAWHLSQGVSLGVGAIRGAKQVFTNDDMVIRAMAGGGLFIGGYEATRSAESAAKAIKKRLVNKGVSEEQILDTPEKVKAFLHQGWKHAVKAWDAYEKIGAASENANRMAIYEATLKETGSHLLAAYKARDILDFSRHGDWLATRILLDSIPFMNARLQGLSKYRRAAVEDPVRFAIKGGALALAGLALYLMNAGKPEYDELEDWEKDSYYHLFTPWGHFRLVKPFETGALFGTVPERMAEAILKGTKGEPWADKLAARMWFMVDQTFNMGAVPQVIKPLWEAHSNYDPFLDRHIESPWDKRLPADRYGTRTSGLGVGIASAMDVLMSPVDRYAPEVWRDSMARHPEKVDHIIRGYFGTLGAWAQGASNIVYDRGVVEADRPWYETRWAKEMIVGDIYRGKDRLQAGSAVVSEFYDLFENLDQVYASYTSKAKTDPAAAAAFYEGHKGEITARNILNNTMTSLKDVNAEIRRVDRSTDISPQEKRALLKDLYKRRSYIAANTVKNAKEARQ